MEDHGSDTIIGTAFELLGKGIQPAIQARAVNHYFGTGDMRKQVLLNNNVTLMPGEMVIMTGPSGSGKSTLLTLIGGLRRVQEGSLIAAGHELHGLNDTQLTEVRRGIGFIFQAHNLFDSLTALQNVRTSLELHPGTRAERDERATAMLKRLGLGERIHYKPAQLSGGQRQRVAIARALVNRPRLVLADEPTAALDKESGREVINVLKELARTEGSTILLVTHDSRILDTADRIVNMVDGRIASEIFVEEAVRVIAFLRRCDLFKDSAPATLTDIAQKMTSERYSAGTVIVTEGEDDDKFYLVRKGRLEVRRTIDGVSTQLATLQAGDYFGDHELVTDEHRSATVAALSDAVVYSLKKADFMAAMAATPTLDEQLRSVFFQRS